MGEAKRRKQSEANYGQVPKEANVRGLVISPPVEVSGSNLRVKSAALDPQELRFSLLFWDRLVWPRSRAINIASDDDASFLESEGILTRPEYTVGGDVAQGMARGQIQAYQDLERTQPGVWALAQGENSFLLEEGLIEEGKGALIELHRAVPIPTQDVPLVEILEFRQRRRDELVLLRHRLESLVSEVEKAENKQEALQERIAGIDSACADLLALGKEWQFPVYLSNLKTTVSWSVTKFVPWVVGGWHVGKTFGLAAASAAAAGGGALSVLEVKADFGWRGARLPMNPYRYAYSMHQEFR